MSIFFTLVFGVIAYFGIRNLRRGWAERKSDHVGAVVRLSFGWAMAFFGGIFCLVSLAVAVLS